ncbi:hypothetical protein ACINNAV81_3557 [Acinetobacter baumannii Naval-81]|nr:hypothetical protein ACINNAV81_3557 [Acinetobacter baumannii Naval-81]
MQRQNQCARLLTEALKYLPAELRKTLTYDRGREMSEHKNTRRRFRHRCIFL